MAKCIICCLIEIRHSFTHSFIHSSLQIKAVEELQKLLNEATASYTNLSDQFSKQAAEINAEIESKQVRGLGKFAYDIAFSQICLLTMTSMLTNTSVKFVSDLKLQV